MAGKRAETDRVILVIVAAFPGHRRLAEAVHFTFSRTSLLTIYFSLPAALYQYAFQASPQQARRRDFRESLSAASLELQQLILRFLSQTDSQGHPLQEPYAAQRAGAQGPLLLQDFNLIDA